MPIYEEYFSLFDDYVAKYGDQTVLLMQVGSFFEVYGLVREGVYMRTNIEQFSTGNELKIANKNSKYKGEQVCMAGFMVSVADKYIERTVGTGYTVVVYTQNEKDPTDRNLYKIYSPGTTLFESARISNNTCCIWFNQSKFRGSKLFIGIATVDVYTGCTDMYEFETDCLHYPSSYDDLERYLSIKTPSEVIMIYNTEQTQMDDVVQFMSLQDVKVHMVSLHTDTMMSVDAQKCEKQIYQQEIIETFFGDIGEQIMTNFMMKPISTRALCFLLHFVQCHNSNLVKNVKHPQFTNTSERMILANHSLKQLNIISNKSGQLSCVLNLLNKCATPMGKRAFKDNLLNPSINPDQITASYEMTAYWIENNIGVKRLLTGLMDFEKCVQLIQDNNFSLGRTVKLLTCVKKIQTIYDYIKDHREIMNEVDDDIIGRCERVCSFIETNLNLEKCEPITKNNADYFKTLDTGSLDLFQSGVYPELDKLYTANVDSTKQLTAIKNYFNKLVTKYEKSGKNTEYIKFNVTKTATTLVGTKRRVSFIRDELEKVRREYELDINTDEYGIKLEYISSITNEPEKIELDLTSIEFNSHGTNKKDLYITSKQIRQIQTNIDEFKTKFAETLSKCITDFYARMKRYCEELISLNTFVKLLDLAECKKQIAVDFNYCKPIISQQSKAFINCTGLRHPLIEHINQKELYVDNDVNLDAIRGMLLFGTNAVGKTSLIKSVGISLIMAQAGLYVPCTTFVYSPYEYLFTRILGNDNLFKGLSTFAVEMCELRTILNLSNQNSLVLGDEVCSGTESSSALSIFMTTLEQLYQKKSTFMFATHFHDIKDYSELLAMEQLKMYHMAVKFNRELNTLVYNRKLIEGPGESKYGLEVCKALNLSDAFLERANQLRLKYNETERSDLSSKPSRYNTLKLKKPMCELCKRNPSDDIHHLQHQSKADERGFIGGFHKNHSANLMSICKTCHNAFHETDDQYKRTKTNGGYVITKIN